jgi:hypothetical protein
MAPATTATVDCDEHRARRPIRATARLMRRPLGMLDSITASTLIKEHMPVVCSNDGPLAVVDHLEGTDSIKLVRDATGHHHYIPLTWVVAVDDKVHLDRTGDQAMQEWSTEPPVAASSPEPVRHVNSVDATAGQPMVTRVMARKQELEAALAALPAEEVRARGDLELALGSIAELLTGDLENVPPVVVASMSRWLESNKHLAESAIPASAPDVAIDPIVDAATGPTIGRSHPAPSAVSML